MVHGSLFSGIGGFDLAARIVGWDNAFSCEIDPFCNRVLKFHFPDETHLHDIRTTDFSLWRGRIDVLSGGFPCQPFSQAGKRKGTDDARHLWPAMLDAIRAIRPRWVVGENVLGIVNWNDGMVFEQVCAQLEAEGYQVQPFVLPACGVDAPHRRYRTFFIAYAEGDRDTGNPGEVRTAHGRPIGAVLSEPNEPSAVWRTSENPDRDGRSDHHQQEESRERQQRDAGAGDCERIRVPTGDTADTDHTGNRSSRFGSLADGSPFGQERQRHEPFDGACGLGVQKDAPDPASQHRERLGSIQSQRGETKQRELGGGNLGTTPQGTHPHSDHKQQTRWDGQGAGGRREPPLGTEPPRGAGVWDDFPTVAPVCRANDGFSDRLDSAAVFEGVVRSPRAVAFNRWRTESVKAYGNAVVVPLIVQIFRAIIQFEKLCAK